MSVQEPQDQFGRESVEDEIEELQDSVDESPSVDPDSEIQEDSESIDVPADESTLSPSDDSALADDSDEVEVPAADVQIVPASRSPRSVRAPVGNGRILAARGDEIVRLSLTPVLSSS